jgi:hypothetical protein
MAPGEPPSSLSTVLQLVGAAASLAVLMTLLGSLANWARFDTLDLPNNAAIATLSQTTNLVTGAAALAWPAAVGLLTAAACVVVRRELAWSLTWALAYLLAIEALVVILVVFTRFGLAWYWPLYAGCAGLLLFVTLAPLSTLAVAYTVFFAMIVVGTIVAALQFLQPPTHLERATIFFDDRRPLVGFWIADTSDLLYIAPQLGDRSGPCEVKGYILGLPHDHIKRVRIEARVPVYPRDISKQPDPCPPRAEAPELSLAS